MFNGMTATVKDIEARLGSLRDELPPHITLIAVSKTHPENAVLAAYHFGQRVFGENKVQELLAKAEVLPKDIEWHLIGHLQSNKVKHIVPFVSMIHAIDSLKLLKEVEKRAARVDRVIDVLLQMHIAEEESKFGFDKTELLALLHSTEVEQMNHICIRGLMGMATFTNNEDQIRREFRSLKQLFDDVRTSFFKEKSTFDTLSMGMSGDYQLAIEEGSTMVRIGSSIFGSRS